MPTKPAKPDLPLRSPSQCPASLFSPIIPNLHSKATIYEQLSSSSFEEVWFKKLVYAKEEMPS
jgi:hypothetical protein